MKNNITKRNRGSQMLEK